MSKSDEQKTLEILHQTEQLADVILMNKHEMVQLDKRRQATREATREVEKTLLNNKSVWITVGNLMIKAKRDTALQLLKKDQLKIDTDINKLRSNQKILVNKHRDLEFSSPFSGTNLKPLDREEFSALKANLPYL